MRFKSLFISLLAVIVLMAVGCADIDAGNHAVTFHKFSGKFGTTLEPGFHVIGPFWDVQSYPTEKAALDFVNDESNKQSESAGGIDVRSKDGLILDVDLTVYYRVSANEDSLHSLYSSTYRTTYRYELLVPKTRSVIRDTFAQYDAADVLGTERGELQQALFSGLNTQLNAEGFEVTSVNIRAIDPPKSIEDAIQAKKVAQQKAEQKEYEMQAAKQDAEIALVKATGEANAIKEIRSALSPEYNSWLMINNMTDDIKIIYTSDGTVPMLQMQQ